MIRRLILAGLALLSLAACAPASGTVTSTSVIWDSQNKRQTYQVCVRGADGKVGCDPVLLDVYLKCSKGDRWPDCQH